MNGKTKALVVSAMFAALIFVATRIIQIPSPLKGYINLGDCLVLLAAWILSPGYGFAAAAIGAALADVFSPYAIYAPATFVIKGIMALVACGLNNLLSKKLHSVISYSISAIAAEIVMISGYFVFEGFMYGFGVSVLNVLPNGVQAFVGIILGVILMKIFSKRIVTMLK